MASLGGLLFLVLYALSKQGVGDPIVIGDQMPGFSALDGESQAFESESLAGSPVLLKFFRGHW